MDNNTLWKLTAENVSDVFAASKQANVTNCSMSDSAEHGETLSVEIIIISTRRIIRKRNFTLSSQEINKKENKVLTLF